MPFPSDISPFDKSLYAFSIILNCILKTKPTRSLVYYNVQSSNKIINNKSNTLVSNKFESLPGTKKIEI